MYARLFLNESAVNRCGYSAVPELVHSGLSRSAYSLESALPASMEDVAKKANVSISTVSRVLNRQNIVNAATRKRVESAIEELGYKPNVFARGLMLRKSHILALVLPDLHGEFYSEIIRGANSRARQMGYQLMVSSITQSEEDSSALSAVLEHGLADGLAFMVSEVDDQTRKTLSGIKIPYVVLDGTVEGLKHDCVSIDQVQGASAMVQHLVAKCHAKRIIFLGGLVTNIDTIDRLSAYKTVMEESGLEVGEKDIFHLDYRYETAYELGLKHVREWARTEASVFAANDEMAAGIIDAAIENGVSVPGGLRVVGFDDTRIAQMTRPRLTTVHVPMSSMGASAIELLCQRLIEGDRPHTKLTLQSELVVRDSCGASGSSLQEKPIG